MLKKCLPFIFAGIFILLWSGLAFPQDTGNIDTVIVQCLEKVRPNTQVVLNVYICNDETIGGFTIPLAFPDTATNLDITCDSISFVGTRVTNADAKSGLESINNDKNRVNVFAIWVFATPVLQPGNVASGPVAKIYFTTGPAWDSTRVVSVDSTLWPPVSTLECTNGVSGVGFVPAFVKGCLGNPVVPPTITVTSPDGGENWVVGSSHNITWTSQNYTGNVKIEYSTDAGTNWTTIAASTANDGTELWVTPNTPTTQGRVKVSSDTSAAISDMSNANFTISAAPTLTVTSPNGGENWCALSNHNITWTSTGSIANVKLEYSTNSGSDWISIIASTSNDGTESWLVPNTPTSGALVKVSESATGIPSDVSNAVFTIAPQVITVTAPNGGENWQAGTSHNITWTSSCFTGTVKIEYSTNYGLSWNSVVTSTANDGTHSWVVPNTPSDSCLVRVSAEASGVPNDISNSMFTISPPPPDQLTITSPNGGENWFTGSIHNITWTSQGTISDVKLEYSIDGGVNWLSVIASTTNDGSYSWTIPDTPSDSCLVKISDVSNSETSDVSDNYFTITRQVVSGCKILFDISHGFATVPEPLDTSYWSHLISALRSAGHEVVTNQSDFNLSGYKVVFLSLPGEDYTASELSALQNFVQNGGAVVISAEHSGGFGTAYLNHVANLFGINFKSNVVLDDIHNDQSNNNWPIISNYLTDPTTEGINQTVIYAGSSLELSGSAYPVAYADTDAYIIPTSKIAAPTSALQAGIFKNDPSGDYTGLDNSTSNSNIVVMAASLYGKGKVWAAGDFNIWANDYAAQNIGIDYYDNQKLALNVFDWSCTPSETVTVTIPVTIPDTCVKMGDFILIPVNIGDVTGKEVYSAEITLDYDQNILEATDATLLGTIAEGRMMFYNKYDGKVEIGISGTEPLSGSGTLVYVGFNVLSLPVDSTIIHFERMRFNEGIPAAEAKDGVIKPCEVYQISGTVRYCLNDNPVDLALLRITGGKSDSVYTDASGGYSFLNLPGGLDYTIKPYKWDHTNGAITAYDASLVLRNVVHLIQLSICQTISADVTGNCEVSAYDASYILRYVVGEIVQFPIGEDWRFFPANYLLDSVWCAGIPDSIFYPDLYANMFNQDYKGILYGDVSGNWAGGDLLIARTSDFGPLPKVSVKEIVVKPGEEFTLPIELTDLSEAYSAEFSLGYDANWLEAKKVSLTGLTSEFMLEDRITSDRIKIALAGARPVSGSGNLAGITFRVSDNVKPGERTEIKLLNLRVNESQLMELNLSYVVSVGTLVPEKFSLSQNRPNPFNPVTSIEYSIPTRSNVLLEVYNLLGQKVVTLVNGEQEAGTHQAIWDGKDREGNAVSSGIYFYRMKSANFSEVKKMVLMK
jgi:hypothetical protein